MSKIRTHKSVADPRECQGRAPSQLNSFISLQLPAKNLQNNKFAHPYGIGAPLYEILDLPMQLPKNKHVLLSHCLCVKMILLCFRA